MGNYSYDDHVELFGGPPEPGEGVDWRDYVDQERKARKEDPPPPEPAPRRSWWRRWRRGA
jgi:hypothetical protein